MFYFMSVHSEVTLPVGVKQFNSINHATDATRCPLKPWRSSAYSCQTISGIVQFSIQLLDKFSIQFLDNLKPWHISAYSCQIISSMVQVSIQLLVNFSIQLLDNFSIQLLDNFSILLLNNLKPWLSSAYSYQTISSNVQFSIQLLDSFKYRSVQHTVTRQFQVSCCSAQLLDNFRIQLLDSLKPWLISEYSYQTI